MGGRAGQGAQSGCLVRLCYEAYISEPILRNMMLTAPQRLLKITHSDAFGGCFFCAAMVYIVRAKHL
jgi:hypothetical protein